MSKIKELLRSNDSILVFDVDGVLALLEFGERTHYEMNDELWKEANAKGINYYTEDKVSKKMQDFLKTKNMDNIYVITTVGNNNEGEFKVEYVNKYYNIKKENVIYVKDNSEKTTEIINIKEKHPNVLDKHIIMIDDTTDILSDIMEHTNFSTAHISSFLDI